MFGLQSAGGTKKFPKIYAHRLARAPNNGLFFPFLCSWPLIFYSNRTPLFEIPTTFIILQSLFHSNLRLFIGLVVKLHNSRLQVECCLMFLVNETMKPGILNRRLITVRNIIAIDDGASWVSFHFPVLLCRWYLNLATSFNARWKQTLRSSLLGQVYLCF